MTQNISYIKSRISKYISDRHEIKAGYIFGSIAQGTSTKLSDIDIAILTDNDAPKKKYPYGYKAQILTDLIKLLKTNNIDLVILNNASPLLKHRVLYYGKAIYKRSMKDIIDFQVKTINEYNDYKYLTSQIKSTYDR